MKHMGLPFIYRWMVAGAKALYWEHAHNTVVPVTIVEDAQRWPHDTLVIIEREDGFRCRVSAADVRQRSPYDARAEQ